MRRLAMAMLGVAWMAPSAWAQPPAAAADPAAPVLASVPDPVRAPARGAVVALADPACGSAAKALARAVYADPSLRPALDEATARALVGQQAPGEPPATTDAPGPAGGEIQDVLDGLGRACSSGCEGSAVARRLATSLGQDLNAKLVVLVTCSASPAEPRAAASARVLRVAEGQFASVQLATAPADAEHGYGWPDSVHVLRALLDDAPAARPAATAPPGPVRSPRGPAQRPGGAAAAGAASTPDAEPADENSLLTSPWFWGGLGAVVAVGVTVFALSQSSLNEPDVVRLQGRVSP